MCHLVNANLQAVCERCVYFAEQSIWVCRCVARGNIQTDSVQHLAKVGSDFASGFGKIQQVKQSQFDEDGSHNTGFQTLKLSHGEQNLFLNKNPGGPELLRLVSMNTHKDT